MVACEKCPKTPCSGLILVCLVYLQDVCLTFMLLKNVLVG